MGRHIKSATTRQHIAQNQGAEREIKEGVLVENVENGETWPGRPVCKAGIVVEIFRSVIRSTDRLPTI